MHGRMTTRLRAIAVALVATVLILSGAGAASAADVAPPRVAVEGDRLVDLERPDEPLQLRGVNRSGTEYACASGADPSRPGRGGYAIFDGPTYNSYDPSRPTVPSDIAQPDDSIRAMRDWGVNAVRIPLSDACWFGDPALNPQYSGSNYQSAIAAYVDQLGRHGIIAVLSLHVASTTEAGKLVPNLGMRLLPMPDADEGPRFWKSVVSRMAGALPTTGKRRNVIYDVFNEPHLDEDEAVPAGAGWACWRDGCDVNTVDPVVAPTPADPLPADPTPTYRTAGVGALVTAIRTEERSQSLPPQPILLGGLDYANDLSGWTTHLPRTPDGRGGTGVDPGLVAAFHAYGARRNADGSVARAGTACNDVACWDRDLGGIRATGRPVVTGEIGQYDCRADFTGAFTRWADGKDVSYLAWTWNAMREGTPAAPGDATGWTCDHGPTLIKLNDGTPTDAFGLEYCKHLRARAGMSSSGETNPCPAARVASDPPADATPVPVPPATPTPTPTPTAPPATSGTPTTTTPPPADPAPGAPAATTPVPETTPAAPVVPPRAVPVEPRNVRITSSSLRLRRGKVSLKVACTAGRTRCTGRIRVRTATKVALGRRRAVLVVLNVAFDVPAGRSATLVAGPTADGRRLLRAVRRVRTVSTVTSMGDLPMTRRLTLSR